MSPAWSIKFTGIVCFLCLLSIAEKSDGATCPSPQVKSQVYTSSEAQMSSEAVVVIDLNVACQGGVKGANLFAEFNGRTYPVGKVSDSGDYQVSFVFEHSKLPKGSYSVSFFDEEMFADFRKAQRSGEDVSNAKTLFSVNFYHPGASEGPLIQSEYIAGGVVTLIFYYAYSTRSKLQSSDLR